jgi:hypothetical protein
MGLAESVQFDRLAKPLQVVIADRHRRLAIEQSGKAPGHQQRVAARATHRLDAAHEIDVRTDQREIEPSAGADVPVAHFAVVQRDAGVANGVDVTMPTKLLGEAITAEACSIP